MSRATELARAEADEVEAAENEEEQETDETPEPEPMPEPEPEARAVPPLDPEKLAKALEGAHGRYEKALRAIPGLEFDAYIPCAKCGSMGYHLADFEPEPEYLKAPDKIACDECNGHGMVISGSLHEQHALEQCTKCAGNGWVTVARPTPQPAYQPQAQPPGPFVPGTPQAPYRDFWGQPTNVPPDHKGDPWGAPTYGQQLPVVPVGTP